MTTKDIDTNHLRPVTLRHRGSGVWIGYLVGPGTFGDSLTLIGRRIWSWRGGRLEMSQLSADGVRSGDRLGEWEVVEIGALTADLLEFRTVDRALVVAAQEFPADGR